MSRLSLFKFASRKSNIINDVQKMGSTVALPGADFITVDGDKIRTVQGYFDQKTFLEQLGLQVIAQPYSLGPISFGTGSTASNSTCIC